MNIIRNTLAVAVAAGTVLSANAGFADDRSVRVVNTSNVPIYSVYITNVDDPDWGRDLLGDQLIPAGGRMRVEPDIILGYCRFDIRIVYDNGYEAVFDRVNLCERDQLRV